MGLNLAQYWRKTVKKLQVSNLLYLDRNWDGRMTIQINLENIKPDPKQTKKGKKLKFNIILGLGAPPGFLNGDNEQVILDVYQRYLEYKLLQGAESNDDLCQEKCPPGSHCSSGVCFCDTGQILSSLGPSPSPISISKGTPTHHHPPLNF